MKTRQSLLTAALLTVAVSIAGGGCYGPLRLTPSDHATVLAEQRLEAEHPGTPGPYEVRRLYYGSGTDRRRPEYRDSVSIVTETVDASKLVSLGESAGERNGYWGFTPKEFPINGRVWYPEGEPRDDRPFPLVLIVHGNHDMKDFSDPGYGYLGELLASRGYVFASVDMNFINGGIRNENDGRGWFLLKHIDAFKGFAADEATPFHGKIDFDRIALIGHSRGGEAVGHAAAFNRLSRYPDDASLEFDFNHGIRGIIAIAPVDGQYLPTGRLAPVENVNYMVFHGSHDGDVTSFHGLRLYNRLEFTDGGDYFKTAIYMYRANHGQWNTVWGNKDNGPRSARRLDLRGLIDGEAQREFAKIYISAFLETTLRDRPDYMPMFRDHRLIGGWLPETMYITQFESSSFRPLATFEEDIDVTTGTAHGVTLRGDSLGVWREELLDLRSRNRPTTSSSQDNNALWLGWNNLVAGDEGTVGAPASYTLSLPAGLGSEWGLGGTSRLDLQLGAVEGRPAPRRPEGEDENQEPSRAGGDDEAARDGTARGESDRDEDEQPVDLSVVLTDADGESASVRLSDYGPIRRPLETAVRRRNDAESFDNQWELVLQSFSIPLADLVEANPDFDPARPREIRLLFDRSAAGTVVVDDIGFSVGRPDR
ncbi:alpha/beta hydrolase family protein [Candidatus Palauibacter sp.]|uniref:alpha/beta hydrolase family protein n=1 Tax=Candidatus Palauibacter sp. TaxID=3101350 RepID=UPI003B01D133